MIEPLKCQLTSLNKKKIIYDIFNIKPEARSLDYDFSTNYEYKYIYKGKEKIRGKHNLITEFLKVEKDVAELIDDIPDGADEKMYRPIINHKKDSDWLKNAQRKFHKIVTKSLNSITYLHSTIKHTSYATNGREHANGKNVYMLCIDISSFFAGIERRRVYKTIKSYLNVDNDVAYYYSRMVTAPLKKNSEELFLAQGLPSSPILAFLCYKTLFDYINDVCSEKNIKFTLYVDDMTFSAENEIPQEFINKVLGLLKSKKYDNKLKINKRKIHNFRRDSKKKVTGVYINDGFPSISGKKHFELFVIYSRLIELLHNEIKDIDEYFEFYNLFLKFSGNLIHLFQVEYSDAFEAKTGNSSHDRMICFYKELSKYVKPGLIKKDKGKKYDKNNLYEDGLAVATGLFIDLSKNNDKLKRAFPKIKRNIIT